jgi:hypothetical protein
MKTIRITAAGLVLAAGLILPLATPSFASTPFAERQIKGTLTLSPGPLVLITTASQLEVVDAAGPGSGWQVVMRGDVRVNSFQCAPGSTCTLPVPGVVGDVITADPGSGMGAVIFNWTVSGVVIVNLISGP